jgi:hypothetical protein
MIQIESNYFKTNIKAARRYIDYRNKKRSM